MVEVQKLGRVLKQRRVMAELTLHGLACASAVSASHLSRIERGERHPSAPILQKLTKPLGFDESELLTLADYLSPPSIEKNPSGQQLDPYVAMVLSGEPIETQCLILTILIMLKNVAKGLKDWEAR